jgi:hypothetical protein
MDEILKAIEQFGPTLTPKEWARLATIVGDRLQKEVERVFRPPNPSC